MDNKKKKQAQVFGLRKKPPFFSWKVRLTGQ